MRPKLRGWDIQLSETFKNEAANGKIEKTYRFRCEKNNDDYHIVWITVCVCQKQLEFLYCEGEAPQKSLEKLKASIAKELEATEELI